MSESFRGIGQETTGRRGPDPWGLWRQWSLTCMVSVTICVVASTCVVGYHYVRLAIAVGEMQERLDKIPQKRASR